MDKLARVLATFIVVIHYIVHTEFGMILNESVFIKYSEFQIEIALDAVKETSIPRPLFRLLVTLLVKQSIEKLL